MRENVRACLNQYKPSSIPGMFVWGKQVTVVSVLRNNESVVVQPACKGKLTVAIDHTEYRKMIHVGALLNDGSYKPLKKDPTQAGKRHCEHTQTREERRSL